MIRDSAEQKKNLYKRVNLKVRAGRSYNFAYVHSALFRLCSDTFSIINDMAHSEEDAQDEGVRPTKRRATQACQECRRRKVKCKKFLVLFCRFISICSGDNDATGGACSNCLNMKIECKQTMQKQVCDELVLYRIFSNLYAQKRGPKVGWV